MTDDQNKPETNPHLKLWDSVCETHPGFTTPVTIGSYTYTAICHTYQARRATENFGHYGKGWGLSISKFNYDHIEMTGMVIHEAVFFYTLESERIEFPIQNAIDIRRYFNHKPTEKYDDEFAKKLETGTLSKALSKLGFSADVFMGKFDDAEYVSGMRIKSGLQDVDESPAVREEKVNEFYDQMKRDIESYALIPNVSAVKLVYNKHMKEARLKCDILGLDFVKVGERFQEAQRNQIDAIENPPKKSETEQTPSTENRT